MTSYTDLPALFAPAHRVVLSASAGHFAVCRVVDGTFEATPLDFTLAAREGIAGFYADTEADLVAMVREW